ncbi:ankyrin repeat domain-containing protein 27-like [Lolium rigidum]|uniref:ankyrin repeat domain-containing protein 27-like n=1 Tax=Lolium rigidum TaxID=89674 RepID=UPI001F5D8F9C|nr:ankyrin repeat domain-containing protein 27-like [Lolium rigidum]
MESSPAPSVDKSHFYAMIDYSINANPGSLESDLVQAIQDGDVDGIKEMVSEMDEEERAELADMDICGSSLLHLAVYLAQLEVCKYFVEELGFDVNAGALCGGVTPLSSAALFGEVVIARYLLDHGADPNKIENSGSVALHNAAKNGNEGVVRLLLSRGARVDIAVAHGTPLHIAASYGKTSVLKTLLDHHADAGANVNYANPNTPLVVATMLGLADCIKYLLEAGANPNISDKQGRMPIQIAASFGRRSHVDILFPFTSPIRAVSNWTVEGIIAHEKLNCSIPKDESCHKIEDRIAELKSQGKKAVKRNDFLGASNLYTKALALNYFDETLYSNRSLCYLKIGKAREALFDADVCIAKRPEWVKGYYRKGAAHMSLKEYEEASEAFQDGLELDPGNAEMEKLLWEACKAMGKDHPAGGSINSAD